MVRRLLPDDDHPIRSTDKIMQTESKIPRADCNIMKAGIHGRATQRRQAGEDCVDLHPPRRFGDFGVTRCLLSLSASFF